MLPTFFPPTIWAISLEICRKPSVLEADDFLEACYRKAMTLKKLWTLLFPHPPPKKERNGRTGIYQEWKKQPKHKVFWRDIPGTSGTQTSGYPGQKLLCRWPFSVVSDREWPGCPGFGSGRPGFGKNFMQENSGLIFRTLIYAVHWPNEL